MKNETYEQIMQPCAFKFVYKRDGATDDNYAEKIVDLVVVSTKQIKYNME